jgi:hypothetical protein
MTDQEAKQNPPAISINLKIGMHSLSVRRMSR